MTVLPPDEVKNLSFAELLAWAMQLWGDSPGGELARVRLRATRAQTSPTLSVAHVSVTLNFEDLPSNVHAQWFLRLGIAAQSSNVRSIDDVEPTSPGFKNVGTTTKRWYLGMGLGEGGAFRHFCKAVGIPPAVEAYLGQRYATFHKLDGPPKRFAKVSFDATSVRKAIEESAGFLGDHPRVDRLSVPDARGETPPQRIAHTQPAMDPPIALIHALDGQVATEHEVAVQTLLEEPATRFDSELEFRLGALLAQHAVRNGLTIEDAREWLSLAELLTIPYARSWPSERLAAMLAQLCLSASQESVNPGVVADRIVAAAALDDRLDEVLERAKQVIDASETQRSAIRVDFVHTLGDGANYLHDGVSLRSFVDWLITTGDTQHV